RERVSVVNDQRGSPTYAPHFVDAILDLARKLSAENDGNNSWGVYHAAGAGTTTWCEMAEEIFRCSAKLGGPTAAV
ncbi:MAG: sugar nucleotide-binding protein, partial [Burkholderiales bacterium]|nr:sugar nucleotide-binding protein [Burkholderiales bacterium]